MNARVLVSFFLGLLYNNGFYSLHFFFFKLELVNFFLKLVQMALAKSAGRPREHPMGLDDQLAKGRVGLKSEAETRLYELDDSRLP